MKRLDVILSERGIAKSREKAKEMILSERVKVEGKVILKPSTTFEEDVKIDLQKSDSEDYLSRGGLKLAKAIKAFNINVKDCVCMDIGASTGGFTDCMLKNGCKKVYAIDVGRGQLSKQLLCDERVENLEGTNIRYIDSNLIDLPVEFFSVDVSFISLNLVLPKIHEIVENNACGVCLIKPQFEVGKGNVGKNGVVRDNKLRVYAINKVCNYCVEAGFSVKGLDYSPIKGPEGNIEYLIYVRKSEEATIEFSEDVKEIVRKSHTQLNYGER